MAVNYVLLLLVGVSAAQYAFKPKYKYEYQYQGVQKFGVKNQWSSLGIRAHVVIQAPNSELLDVKLSDVQSGELYNQPSKQTWRQDPPISYQAVQQNKSHLELPFRLALNHGIIESIRYGRNEPMWVVNIKKSIAQQLQLDIKESHAIREPSMTLLSRRSVQDVQQKARMFRVMEKSIGGECETLYEMTPVLNQTQKYSVWRQIHQLGPQTPQPPPESFKPFLCYKTKNYDNCVQRPNYRHLTPPAVHTFSSDVHHMAANRSVSTRYILDGDITDFTIRAIVSEAANLVFPYGGVTDQVWAVTNQTFVLIKKGPLKNTINQAPPSSFTEDKRLAFRYQTSNNSPLQKPSQTAEPQISSVLPGIPIDLTKQAMPSSQTKSNLVKLIQSIDQSLNVVPDPERVDVPEMILVAQWAVSLLSQQHLQQVQQQLSSPVQKEIFYEILTLTGTNPALYQVLTGISQSQIEPMLASSLISKMPMSIKTPTPEMIAKFMELRRSAPAQRSEQVRTSLAMALGNIFHQVCVSNSSVDLSYPTSIYGRFCDESQQSKMSEYIQQLQQEIRSKPEPEKYVYIQTLGSIGHKKVIPVLKEFIEARQSPMATSVAISALYRLAFKEPQQVQRLVSAVFHDITREPIVRQTAFETILRTYPPIHYLQKVAVSTWTEPSQQVRSYVHSALSSMANMTRGSAPPLSPMLEVSRNARIVLPLVRPPTAGISSSSLHFIDSLFVNQVGLMKQLSYKNSAKPSPASSLKLVVLDYVNGLISSKAKVALTSVGPQRALFDAVFASLRSAESSQRQSPRDIRDPNHTLQQLVSMLQSRPYPYAPGESTLNLYMQFLGCIDRFFSTSETQIRAAISRIVQGGSYDVQSAQVHTIVQTSDKTVTIPSEVGLPIIISKKSPLVLSVRGSMKVQWSYQEQVAKVVADNIQPVLMKKDRVAVATISPFTKRQVGAGVDMNTHVALPITFKVSVDVRSSKVEFLAKFADQPSALPVLHTQSRPFTCANPVDSYERYSAGSDTKEVRPRKQYQQAYNFGRAGGVAGELKVVTESPASLGSAYDYIRQMNSPYDVYALLVSPPMCSHHIDITIHKDQTETKQIEFSVQVTNSSQPQQSPAKQTVLSPEHQRLAAQALKDAQQEFQKQLAPTPEENRKNFAIAAAVSFHGSQVSHYTTVLAKTRNLQRQVKSFRAALKAPSLQVCVSGELKTAPLSEDRRRLASEPVHMPFQSSISFGSSSCQDQEVQVRGHVEADQKAKEYAQQSIETQICQNHEQQGHPNSADCQTAKDQLTIPTNLQVDASWNKPMPAALRNVSVHADELLKYVLYPYMSSNPLQANSDKKVSATVRWNPSSRQISVHLMKPYETTKFEQIPIYTPYIHGRSPTLRRSLLWKTMDVLYGTDKTMCVVDPKVVKTFDNQTINMQLPSACPTLLAANTNLSDPLVILGREVSGAKQAVVQVGGQVIVAQARGGDIVVTLNDKPVNLQKPKRFWSPSNPQTRVFVQKLSDRVKISIPSHSAKVEMSAGSIYVYMNPLYHAGVVHGLCGNQDGERTDEMADLQGCVHQHPDTYLKALQLPMSAATQQCHPQSPSQCVRTYLSSLVPVGKP